MSYTLHVALISELNTYGGGVETWIQYFTKEILKDFRYNKYYIYYIKKSNYNRYFVFPSDYDNDRIILRSTSTRGLNGPFSIFKFVLFNFFRYIFSHKKNDIFICVGATYTGILAFFLKLIYHNNIILITWIRSISIEEKIHRSSKCIIFSRIFESLAFRYSNFIITNGADTENYYKSKYRKYKYKIHKINNSLSNLKLLNITCPVLLNNDINIAYTGRLINSKGFSDFLSSVDKYYQSIYSLNTISFHAYGMVNNISIDKRVIFHNFYTPADLYGILNNNQVIIFLNKSNIAGGVSHSILEAMASGRLIIAWDNPIHNQVLNADNSILIKEGDIESLVKVYQDINSISAQNLSFYTSKCEKAKSDAMNYLPENHISDFNKILEKSFE